MIFRCRHFCRLSVFGGLFLAGLLQAEDGYRLWLRYDKTANPQILTRYQAQITQLIVPQKSTAGEELKTGLSGLLGKEIPTVSSILEDGAVIAGTPQTSPLVNKLIPSSELEPVGNEGYIIRSLQHDNHSVIVIAGNQPTGVLYGVFAFLRLIQTQQSIDTLSIVQKPRIQKRLLNHWDNLDGSIERGYAGSSIWNWDDLPEKINPRIKNYARANASIGINGAVLNNVNSQAAILTDEYIAKAAAIADVLRPYGIQIYFCAKFTSPMEIGGLSTADPLDAGVQQWWKEKAAAIYRKIPDFGGFLVKAYSEGQPGPQQYGRSHADGANMLADALKPYGGIVMWRAFVYELSIDKDRAKCAYLEFVPLDGKFAPNTFVQVKNGPVDFQPREPFNPLFGAMPKTPLMMELQITQEYTGQAKHLVYQAPMWKEVLDCDTYENGPGTPVANILDGSAEKHSISGIAGVSGIGSDRNWMGHHFSQANWYAFGRLAWDPALTSEQIAEEWIRMTWSNEPQVVTKIQTMMAGSWEACVDYMTPIGLHHLFAEDHHYGPQPDYTHPVRPEWSPTYYHRAAADGIGFDRSSKGSNAVSQYHKPLCELWDSPKTCPEKYLLWFHHLPWDYRLESGSTVWEQLKIDYQKGVDYVTVMQNIWQSLEGRIDSQRFDEVNTRLQLQHENAILWKDACLKYFGGFRQVKIQERCEP
jgi:alpha-glucuronidase